MGITSLLRHRVHKPIGCFLSCPPHPLSIGFEHGGRALSSHKRCWAPLQRAPRAAYLPTSHISAHGVTLPTPTTWKPSRHRVVLPNGTAEMQPSAVDMIYMKDTHHLKSWQGGGGNCYIQRPGRPIRRSTNFKDVRQGCATVIPHP
jgi:hypothetical protein